MDSSINKDFKQCNIIYFATICQLLFLVSLFYILKDEFFIGQELDAEMIRNIQSTFYIITLVLLPFSLYYYNKKIAQLKPGDANNYITCKKQTILRISMQTMCIFLCIIGYAITHIESSLILAAIGFIFLIFFGKPNKADFEK